MTVDTPVRWFGSVEVDLAAYCIRRDGAAYHLRPQTAQVLDQLMRHSGRVVTKDELVATVWNHAAVSDSALAQCIKELRHAFADNARHSTFIRTIPKVGYQFVAPRLERPERGAASALVSHTPRVDGDAKGERMFALAPESSLRRPLRRTLLGGVFVTAVTAVALIGGGAAWRLPVPTGSMTSPSSGAPLGHGETTQSWTTNLEAYRRYVEAVDKAENYHPAEAIALLREALALDPSFVMARARIGYAYIVQGDWSAAEGIPYLREAFEQSDRLAAPDRLAIVAWYSIARRDYAGAIRAYQQLIGVEPLNSESYWRLGRLLAGEEQLAQAIDVLERGAAIAPYDTLIHNALAGVYGDVGRYDDAIAEARRCVALAPEEANGHDSLGLAYHAAGRLDEAAAAYDHAIALKPRFALAVLHRGNLRYQRGQFHAALDDYQRFVAISDTDTQRARGHMSRAWVLLARDEPRLAWEAAQTAVRLSPDAVSDPHLWVIARRNGVPIAPPAEPPVDQARAQREFLRVDYARQAMAAEMRNDRDTALALLREAVRHRPIVWNIETEDDCVARYYLDKHEWASAVREYREVVKAHPAFARAYFELAQAYDALGDRASASAEYQAFLRLWSTADADAPQIRATRARLDQVATARPPHGQGATRF